MIRQYIRDENKNPRGVVVAIAANKVGWSLLHPKDKFDKDMALRIAYGRCHGSKVKIPERAISTIERMKARSMRYFKVGFSPVAVK